MALKSDQQRVMGLLKDTITLLCKNGLTFETKFAIDAVIGVTIDEKDLFYLSMNEIVKSDAAPPDSSTKTGVARIEQSDSDGQLSGEEAHTASGKKRRKRKRPVKQEESGSDGENGIQSDGGGSDDADVSRLEDSGSGIPSPRKKSNIKVESGGDDDADIVFVKQELDDSWSQSIAQDGENSSYQGYPNTSMSQSDFSQDPNFSADNSLVAMGLANDSGMWAQNVGGSPGQPRPFRPRGPRSFTATTPGQQADGDGQLTGQDNLQLGSHVPVLVPPECKDPLQYLADRGTRSKAGINPKNPYMFANSGMHDLNTEVYAAADNVGMKRKFKRKNWQAKEIHEIEKYADDFLKKKKTPTRKQAQDFIRMSQEAGGILQFRTAELIMKKLSAMNIKARKQE